METPPPPYATDQADPLLLELGGRVRARRTELGWSRARLSEACGVSARYLADLESGRGNISVGRLAAVARALGTGLRTLLPEDEATTRSEAGGPPVIALLGLRGAGKSSVGRALAERLGLPFVELDALIEAEAGLSLDELFALHGEGYYRRLERDVLARFLDAGTAAVLATGGGLVTSPETYALLLGRTRTVWLKARPLDHWNRVIAQGDHRPMAGKRHAMAELKTLLAQRTPLYARAHQTVDTTGRSIEETVTAVTERGVLP
jgi:XRE family transcriptional regulator, aerobic/anaerobic benzoate catabolism transcriptional regulator